MLGSGKWDCLETAIASVIGENGRERLGKTTMKT
jgi:hypothetical protein